MVGVDSLWRTVIVCYICSARECRLPIPKFFVNIVALFVGDIHIFSKQRVVVTFNFKRYAIFRTI